jgi:hypothetical protein
MYSKEEAHLQIAALVERFQEQLSSERQMFFHLTKKVMV